MQNYISKSKHTRTIFTAISTLLIFLVTIHTHCTIVAAVTLQVSAGPYDRVDTPVKIEIKPDSLTQGKHTLLEGTTKVGTAHVSSIAGTTYLFLKINLKANQKKTFTLVADKTSEDRAKLPIRAIKDDNQVSITSNSQVVLQYNHAPVAPPASVKSKRKLYTRSGFIHPVRTPSGITITNAHPAKHLHHFGIWMPWRESSYQGQKINFWEIGSGSGTVRYAGIEAIGQNDIAAWFQAKQEHVALKIKNAPKVILNETWRIAAYNTTGYHLFDVISVQSCATDKPFTVEKKHYGGMGLRGSNEWEDPTKVNFFTSENKKRKEGNFTHANWTEMHGLIGGKSVGIMIMGAPTNFRAPQKTRIHPKEPFFCFAPGQDEKFNIEPGQPYVSKFRFYVHDGKLDIARCKQMWNDYANPPTVRIIK
jgi:hypothetical protein